MEKSAARTFVIGPYRPLSHGSGRTSSDSPPSTREHQNRLEEAIGLAQAIDLEIVSSLLLSVPNIRPSTYLGKGKVENLAAQIQEQNIELVVMDCALSPGQQRNLEKAFQSKVIDRTGLILEIFGRRARTREGTLQVELAHLAYQKSRLVRSWTHLERQRGGFGFLGGPGETQIETDRRLIQERMNRIQSELENVKKTRALHREKRREIPYIMVALVGYTNSGKSTLFNMLTHAEVQAQDMLFATLDPTIRGLRLPLGSKVMVSDTVGFISDLPHVLVSAFRATLEEVTSADIILHVRDITHPDSDAQKEDVEKILRELELEFCTDLPSGKHLIEVWNKIDVLSEEEKTSTLERGQGPLPALSADPPCLISALTGEGIDSLLSTLESRIAHQRLRAKLVMPETDGSGLHWLYEHTEILSRESDNEGAVHLTIRLLPERLQEIQRRFPGRLVE